MRNSALAIAFQQADIKPKKQTLTFTKGKAGTTRQPDAKPTQTATEWLEGILPTNSPLAIGIHEELWKIKPEHINKSSIRRALDQWCNRKPYLQMVVDGVARRSLKGRGSPITNQQRQRALALLSGKGNKGVGTEPKMACKPSRSKEALSTTNAENQKGGNGIHQSRPAKPLQSQPATNETGKAAASGSIS